MIPMSNSSPNIAEQSASRRRVVRVIDRMPDWVVVLAIVLLALVLMGVIVAFA